MVAFLLKIREFFTSFLKYVTMNVEGEGDMKKYLCEFLGTCILVLFGCGVAIVSEGNLIATSLAFGLSIVAVAYTIGKVSGCHVNPAVTFAVWIDKKISTKDFIGYVIAQVLGAIAGSGLLSLILDSTMIGSSSLGANTFGNLSASNITMLGALVVEIVLTFVFVLAVLGVTRDSKKENVAPIVIGLALVLVHLLGIGLTGTSVNPARSLGPAIFMGEEYLSQVWVFIIGPLVGAAFASLVMFFIDLEDEGKTVLEAKKSESVVSIPSTSKMDVKEETSPKKNVGRKPGPKPKNKKSEEK